MDIRERALEMIRANKTTLQIVLATGISDRSVRRLRQKVRAGQDAAELAPPDFAMQQLVKAANKAGVPLVEPVSAAGNAGVRAAGAGSPVVDLIASAETKPEPTVAESVASRRQAAELDLLRRQNRQLQDALIEAQDWTARMDALKAARLEPADWKAKTPHVRKNVSLTPVLFTSDFQLGEVIRPEEVDGINEYNSEIFQSRYTAMIEKTIMLASENTGATEFPGCVYLRGGDTISGEIHEELAQTNDLSAIPAVRLAQRMEREGIRRLRDKFGRVRVISVPGNHGRTVHKPVAKGNVRMNFETLLSWWLQDGFDSDPNVTFYTPQSGDAFFQVSGWNVLMAHGDRMGSKGGAGFVGPAATIARGHQKLFQNFAQTGRIPDLILTGHLHTSLKLSTGYANGSLAGYSEYARDLRASPDAAKQWLLFMHEREKVSHHFELYLSGQPRRTIVHHEDLSV